jgi:two-component system OmpR family sensor kinase
MNWRVLRQWLGPVLTILVGLLGAGFARAGWITNLVFQGNFHFDLSVLLFFIGLLAGLIWVVVILVHQSLNRRVEKALAEERAAQGQERQRFLRRLDHELKNPLTTIRLGIANLKEDPSSGEEMTGSLERISHQAQRLQILVENLRRLAEMDENSLDRITVNLQEVLEEAEELACGAPEWQGGVVHLSIQQVPWPLSPVSGDRDLLVVAFRNLIENALKFSGPHGQVEVRASEDGHNLLVEIDDNGRGIPPEDLPHIFDELYRGENARDMPGSGLGLALVRRIIELHDGSLKVNSRPEQGTMVRVQLPIGSN